MVWTHKKRKENRMVKGVFENELNGVRRVGRWIDSVKEILSYSGLGYNCKVLMRTNPRFGNEVKL